MDTGGGTDSDGADATTCERIEWDIYAIGGSLVDGTPFSVVEEYDPVLDQWMSVSSLPSPRRWGTAATAAGRVYVIGGLDDANAQIATTVASVSCPGRCGDGVVDPEEECDDGNTDNCDGCDSECIVEECGNDKTQCNEECDDGNTAPCDGCDATCVIEFCGDGVLCEALGEECDDGNTDVCDGCDAGCVIEFCGDGILCEALDEECDGTDDTACPGRCLADCTCEPCMFTIGGAIYTDCANPLTSGEPDVQVTVTGTDGPFTATTGGPSGVWQIPDVPCGTYTVTPDKQYKALILS